MNCLICGKKLVKWQKKFCSRSCAGKYNMRGEKNSMFNRHHSKKALKKMSLARKGKTYEEIMGKEQAEILKSSVSKQMSLRVGTNHPLYGKRGEDSPNYGSKRTKKQRKNMGFARIGKYGGENHPLYGKRGIDSPNYGRKCSEEFRMKMGLIRIKTLAEGKVHSVFTKPHKLIVEKMKEINLWNENWKNECAFNLGDCRGSIDTANPKEKIAIFIDGDYWHANPIKYKEDSVMIGGKLAKSIWEKDKKITKSLEDDGWKVIRLWEHDIKKDVTKCVAVIRREI